MLVKLHANATTTPKMRAYIQASSASVAELTRELGVGETTIRRWKRRTDGHDRSSRPQRLQTRFDAVEEEIAVELRTRLGLSIDDILEVMRRGVRADISRSALHRCLKRHGVSARPAAPTHREAAPFETTAFGYVHLDLKHLTRIDRRPAYVFVAIERTTSFVHVEVITERSAETVAACFERFLDAFGHPVHTVLTDNGSEFTDRFGGARWTTRSTGTGRHAFDRACQARGIRHKLTRPYRPQTNGKVERFNRRLGQALADRPANGANAGRNRFASHPERNDFIHRFVDSYNRTRLRSLGYKAPAELLANLTGHNTQAGIHGAPAPNSGRMRKKCRAGVNQLRPSWDQAM
jgi:transposase InsO family protein